MGIKIKKELLKEMTIFNLIRSYILTLNWLFLDGQIAICVNAWLDR